MGIIDDKNYDSALLGSIIDQISANNAHQTLEKYKTNQEFSNKIREEAKQYENKPSSDWPKIKINWDLTKKSQKFALDSVQDQEFKNLYPEGFSLGYVDLEIFDKILCHYSRRDKGELWTSGFSSKLSYLIVYLSKGHPISPPLVFPHPDFPKEVMLGGGHHRYAIAKEISEKTFPIYVEHKNKEIIEGLVSIKWV